MNRTLESLLQHCGGRHRRVENARFRSAQADQGIASTLIRRENDVITGVQTSHRLLEAGQRKSGAVTPANQDSLRPSGRRLSHCEGHAFRQICAALRMQPIARRCVRKQLANRLRRMKGDDGFEIQLRRKTRCRDQHVPENRFVQGSGFFERQRRAHARLDETGPRCLRENDERP